MIRTKKTPRIATKNAQGRENGFLLPIANVHEGFVQDAQWPKQVYCTVANPGEIKGPHLHKKRWGLFTCIRGNIKIVVRIDGKYEEYYSGEDHEFQTVQVPAGIPAALVNIGQVEAYILNMPSPAWRAEDQDDWDVTFDDYDFGV
ncbi:MAG: WxcM-like domain-containing protein [Spirochaetales bacterium]|nr:WxcM-like domain-containing protein [Spirochaetales bacterium]